MSSTWFVSAAATARKRSKGRAPGALRQNRERVARRLRAAGRVEHRQAFLIARPRPTSVLAVAPGLVAASQIISPATAVLWQFIPAGEKAAMRRLKLPQLSRLCCVPLVLGGSAGIDVAGSLFQFDGFFFKKFPLPHHIAPIPPL